MIRKLLALFLISWTTAATAQIPNPPTGLTGITDVRITANIGGNVYCSPQGTWLGPTKDGPANLPLQCMNTALANTPSPGAKVGPYVTLVSLQAAMNANPCGTTYLVNPVDLGPGSLQLPQKNCDDQHWNTIESTGITDSRFPAEGNRVTPCWAGIQSMLNRSYSCPAAANLMFSIEAVNASNAVRANGGDHWRIIGGNIGRVSTGGIAIYNLVDLSATIATQTHHIIFDRCMFQGIERTFPSTSTATDTSTTRAIYLGQSNHVAVIDSWFANFYDTSSMSANGNTDSQCVGGGFGGVANSGWGVYKFVNDWCEASGEGILLGGSQGPPLTPTGCTIMVNCNLDVATDIEVRQNHFFKPPQWNGNTTVPGGTGWPVVKNGFEMKMGARALFEGNDIENCWYHAQVCYAFSVAPVNQQSGGAPSVGTCSTCVVRDFTYRYNYAYNVAYGIAVYSFMPAGCATCQTQGSNGVSIHDNLIGDNLNLGNLSSNSAGDEMEILATNDSTNQGLNKIQNLNVSHNTFVRGIRALTIFGGPTGNTQMVGITMLDNIWTFATYGFVDIGNSGGCDTPFDASNNAYGILQACVTNWSVFDNAVFNWNSTTLGKNWPTDGKGTNNFFFTGTSSIGFVNYGTGDSKFNPQNYALAASSPLKGKASDGRDVGADINTLVQYAQAAR